MSCPVPWKQPLPRGRKPQGYESTGAITPSGLVLPSMNAETATAIRQGAYRNLPLATMASLGEMLQLKDALESMERMEHRGWSDISDGDRDLINDLGTVMGIKAQTQEEFTTAVRTMADALGLDEHTMESLRYLDPYGDLIQEGRGIYQESRRAAGMVAAIDDEIQQVKINDAGTMPRAQLEQDGTYTGLVLGKRVPVRPMLPDKTEAGRTRDGTVLRFHDLDTDSQHEFGMAVAKGNDQTAEQVLDEVFGEGARVTAERKDVVFRIKGNAEIPEERLGRKAQRTIARLKEARAKAMEGLQGLQRSTNELNTRIGEIEGLQEPDPDDVAEVTSFVDGLDEHLPQARTHGEADVVAKRTAELEAEGTEQEELTSLRATADSSRLTIGSVPLKGFSALVRRAANWQALHPLLRWAIKDAMGLAKDLAYRVHHQGQSKAWVEAKEESARIAEGAEEFIRQHKKLRAGEITHESFLSNIATGTDGNGIPVIADSPQQQAMTLDAWRREFEDGGTQDLNTYTDNDLRRDASEFLQRMNNNTSLMTEKLQELVENLDRPGLATLMGARMQLTYEKMSTARAAEKLLNLGPTANPSVRQLVTESFLSRMHTAMALERSFRAVLSGMGRGLRIPNVKLNGEGMAEALKRRIIEEAGQRPAVVWGKAVSVELGQAIKAMEAGQRVNWSSDTLRQELNVLASIARDMEIRPETAAMADQLSRGVEMGVQGLLTVRIANLLSSGVTFWTNSIGGLFRAATLPLYQPIGAVAEAPALWAQGKPSHVREAAQDAALQYITMARYTLNNLRLAGHSFREGAGLWDPTGQRIDNMGSGASASSGTMEVRPGMWDLNQVGGEEWRLRNEQSAKVFDWLWRGLTLPLRGLVSVDTLVKAASGNAEHWTRLYRRALEDLRHGEYDGDIYTEAARRADQRLEADLMEVIVHPDDPRRRRVIPGAAMRNNHAITTGRQATFQDDILAKPEKRSYQKGMDIARGEGITDEWAASDRANAYMTEADGDRVPKAVLRSTHIVWGWPALLSKGKHMAGIGPVISIVAPFLKTPTDIIKTGMRHTPGANFLVDSWWRDVTSEDPYVRRRALGEVAAGSMVLAGINYALNSGTVEFTGAGPAEIGTREKWMNIEGKQPFSWRQRGEDGEWGDWHSYRVAEPITSVIGMIADYREMSGLMSQEEKDRAGAFMVLYVAGRGATGMLGKTWFAGLADFSEAVQRTLADGINPPGKRSPIGQWFTRQAVTFTPYSSALRAWNRGVDPTRRSVQQGTPWEELAGEFKKNIPVPGWSEDVPPVRNPITGEPLYVGGVNGEEIADLPWFSGMEQFDPRSVVQVAKSPTDPVLRELAEVGIGMGAISGRSARNRFTKSGRMKNARLNWEEWDAWLNYRVTLPHPRRHNLTLHEWLGIFIQSEQYRALPASENSEILTDFKAKALQAEIGLYDKLADDAFLRSEAGERIANLWAEFSTIEQQESFQAEFGEFAHGAENAVRAMQEAARRITGNQ